jgi:hypothetical protein
VTHNPKNRTWKLSNIYLASNVALHHDFKHCSLFSCAHILRLNIPAFYYLLSLAEEVASNVTQGFPKDTGHGRQQLSSLRLSI